MSLSPTARRILDWAELAAGVGLVGLILLSVAILADSMMRTLFDAPIYGLSDLAEIVTPPIVASCIPAAIAARRNIAVRFLGSALPPRAGQFVELIGQTAALVVLVGIVWQVGIYTANIIGNGQYTWLLRIPLGPTWVLAEALLVACVPVQALVVAETWLHLRAGASLKDTLSEDNPELQV